MSNITLEEYPVPTAKICAALEEGSDEHAKCMTCADATTEYQLKHSTANIEQQMCSTSAEDAKKCCFHDHFGDHE